MRRLGHEVIGPYLVAVLWSQAAARTVGKPQPASLRLSGRHFQALGSPDALDSLGVHLPTGHLQEVGDPAIAVAAELASECDDRRGQGVLVLTHLWLVTLAGSMLAQSLAHPAL